MNRTCLLALVALIIGMGLGWSARACESTPRRSEPVASDYNQPVRVIRCNNPGLGSMQFTPYRAIVDGNNAQLADSPAGKAEVWRIELRDGRVVLFATQQPID
jgi:hypothetical protein